MEDNTEKNRHLALSERGEIVVYIKLHLYCSERDTPGISLRFLEVDGIHECFPKEFLKNSFESYLYIKDDYDLSIMTLGSMFSRIQ